MNETTCIMCACVHVCVCVFASYKCSQCSSPITATLKAHHYKKTLEICLVYTLHRDAATSKSMRVRPARLPPPTCVTCSPGSHVSVQSLSRQLPLMANTDEKHTGYSPSSATLLVQLENMRRVSDLATSSTSQANGKSYFAQLFCSV